MNCQWLATSYLPLPWQLLNKLGLEKRLADTVFQILTVRFARLHGKLDVQLDSSSRIILPKKTMTLLLGCKRALRLKELSPVL